MSKINGMNTTLAKKPVINHTNKTITVTEKFFTEASKPFTNEFYDLMKLREALPGYEVITRSHRKPRRTENTPRIPKFVSYEHMEKYIKLLPDSEKLLLQLQLVKDYADAHNYASSIVFKWFNETFPDYRYAPKIDKEGNLIAHVNVIDFDAYRKSVEEKEQARAAAKAKAEPSQAADPQDTDELPDAV